MAANLVVKRMSAQQVVDWAALTLEATSWLLLLVVLGGLWLAYRIAKGDW